MQSAKRSGGVVAAWHLFALQSAEARAAGGGRAAATGPFRKSDAESWRDAPVVYHMVYPWFIHDEILLAI